MDNAAALKNWSSKIDGDLEFLAGCLRTMLEQAGEGTLAQSVPWANGEPPKAVDVRGDRLVQVLSIAFQVLNIVEENAAVAMRRDLERQGAAAADPGLWGDVLSTLQRCGHSPESIAMRLNETEVEVVLTAHPTEAKRPVVLKHHRELFETMQALESPGTTPSERQALFTQLKVTLERLWRTGEMYLDKPTVESELDSVLDYLGNVFPQAVQELERRLKAGWEAAGFPLDMVEPPRRHPILTFGTWVGGDRDGHPFVTAAITRQTLRRLRAAALAELHNQLRLLEDRLSLSELFQRAPRTLLDAIEKRAEELDVPMQRLRDGAAHEPWQQFVRLMAASLPTAGANGFYDGPSVLQDDLDLLEASLTHVGAARIAKADLNPLRRHIQTFGFHGARLDIRQNSQFYEKALAELLEAAGMDAQEFLDANLDARQRFLEEELASLRPLAPRGAGMGPHARDVMDTFMTVAGHAARFGTAGLGSFIVSMTRGAADLFVVYIFARETGLLQRQGDRVRSTVPVVPLFETVQDLEASPHVLGAFLDHPITRASLPTGPSGRPLQQVMIGYSDSNKGSGLVASHWQLHRSQHDLTAEADRRHVDLQFFHGRGGTFSRGAGPTHRFLDALPPGSLRGAFRLTEQGETIAQKYGQLPTAVYNLELLLAGVTGVTQKHGRLAMDNPEAACLMDRLAHHSAAAYRSLLESEGFLDFWRAATPIDALEQSFIGSRPARRTGKATFEDLRAIPWVFSWSQARFYLPGWYGLGSGLYQLRRESPNALDQMKAFAKTWPFLRYVLYNAETSLASVSFEMMEAYASLVSDEALRVTTIERIKEEWRRTSEAIEQIMGAPRHERRPRMTKTVGLREEGLRILHLRQVSLLRQWRGHLAAGEEEEAAKLVPRLLLSINAIASGLRATG